jgi:glycerol-3-phosphate O-acyltransferase
MYRVDAPFDEIFDQTAAFLLRIGALARDGAALAPGPEPRPIAFLAELMRPYLEAYRLAAGTALALLASDAPRQPAPDRRALVREALERGRAAFLAGQLSAREALSKATLENAVEWLVLQQLVREEAGRLRLAAGDDGAELRAIMDGIAPHLAS